MSRSYCSWEVLEQIDESPKDIRSSVSSIFMNPSLQEHGSTPAFPVYLLLIKETWSSSSVRWVSAVSWWVDYDKESNADIKGSGNPHFYGQKYFALWFSV